MSSYLSSVSEGTLCRTGSHVMLEQIKINKKN